MTAGVMGSTLARRGRSSELCIAGGVDDETGDYVCTSLFCLPSSIERHSLPSVFRCPMGAHGPRGVLSGLTDLKCGQRRHRTPPPRRAATGAMTPSLEGNLDSQDRPRIFPRVRINKYGFR